MYSGTYRSSVSIVSGVNVLSGDGPVMIIDITLLSSLLLLVTENIYFFTPTTDGPTNRWLSTRGQTIKLIERLRITSYSKQ